MARNVLCFQVGILINLYIVIAKSIETNKASVKTVIISFNDEKAKTKTDYLKPMMEKDLKPTGK